MLPSYMRAHCLGLVDGAKLNIVDRGHPALVKAVLQKKSAQIRSTEKVHTLMVPAATGSTHGSGFFLKKKNVAVLIETLHRTDLDLKRLIEPIW